MRLVDTYHQAFRVLVLQRSFQFVGCPVNHWITCRAVVSFRQGEEAGRTWWSGSMLPCMQPLTGRMSPWRKRRVLCSSSSSSCNHMRTISSSPHAILQRRCAQWTFCTTSWWIRYGTVNRNFNSRAAPEGCIRLLCCNVFVRQHSKAA